MATTQTRTSDIANQHLLDEIAAAKFLAISPRTLWGLAKQGRVRFVKIGRSKRYRVVDLEDFAAHLARESAAGNAAAE